MAEDAAGSFLNDAARARIRTVVRHVVGLIVGGVLSAAVWLLVVQEARTQDHTDLDFVRAMALLFDAEGVDRRDTGSAGLYLTLAAGVVFAALHALVVPRLVRRSWWIQAVPPAVAIYVLWGAVMSPSRPSGFFGLQAGGVSSALAFLVGAAAFGIVLSRCYSLIISEAWWRAKEQDISHGLDQFSTARSQSLELPEERAEQGRIGSGG